MWSNFLSIKTLIKLFPTDKMWSKLHNVMPALQRKFKENVCKSKQVQGGKLYCLDGAKFNFHMISKGEICPGWTG